MGKPTGFLEYERELPSRRPVQERIKDYREFMQPFTASQLNQQSARCMDCGIPFCHNGCPLGNLIPEFNDAVFRGDFEEAYRFLALTNNFPEFTGRICPAPCESACVLGINRPPITIEEIEKHIIEIAFEKGYVRAVKPVIRTGKTVAIIGSGPAGLAVAAQLNAAGHTVTVFERDAKPGGLLRYGIPDFKLEKWVIDRRLAIMQEEGIVFECNANVGAQVSINDILRRFSAVVLAGGSTIPRDLSIPGREADGVHFAMDFLKKQNQAGSGEALSSGPTALGKHVIVIGGGDTGSDCIGTSVRQGASSIKQFELLPQPPKERNEAMPWPVFPMLLKTTSSHEEGSERHWAVATKAFLKDDAGKLKALLVADLEWAYNGEGRASQFVEVAGSERELPCDLALLAMGFMHPQHEGLIQQLGVELDARGNVQASEKDFTTNIGKIFVAGDMRRGQSLVVWAISEGRECAARVDAYLNGNSLLPVKDQHPLLAHLPA